MSKVTKLPQGWVTASLAQCSTRITDGTHLPPKFEDSGIPFVFVKHIVKGCLTFDDTRFISEQTWQTFQERCPIEIGDVLYTAVGSYGVAVPVATAQRFSFQRHIAHIKPHSQIDNRFVTYFLNSPFGLTQAHRVARGVAQKTVTLGDLKQFSVSLAPLNEQRRIVAKIDELFSDLDAGVAALERIKANLKRCRAAVLKAAVEGRLTETWRSKHPRTEPAAKLVERILAERRQKWEEEQLARFAAADMTPPKGWREKYIKPAALDTTTLPELPQAWCWVSMEQLCEVGTGTTPSRSNSSFYDGGTIPWIMSTAVNRPFVDEASECVTDEALEETTLRLYPVGTLLVALYGEGKTRGMISELRIAATINQALGALVFQKSAELVRLYVKQFLTSNYTQLRRQAAGGMQPNLNLGIVKQIAIPLPPLDEQNHITALLGERLSQIEAGECATDHSLKRAARLRQAILKRAFEGKLVPQDATDEPADKLLERIRRERKATNGSVAPRTRRSRTPSQQAET